LPIEERRAELRRLIPRSPKSRLQFSEAIAGSGPYVFASAEHPRGPQGALEISANICARRRLGEW